MYPSPDFVLIAVVTWSLLGATARAGEEIQDVIFSTPYASGRPKTARFDYNGHPIGEGREGFAAIVEQIGKLPRGTSIVWGPNYSRCGACSPAQPSCVPKFLYPDLWKQFEALAAERGLNVSSLFPGPHFRAVTAAADAEQSGRISIAWTNFRGPETPHDEVLYLVNDRFVGRGDEGLEQILARLRELPEGAAVGLPQYENSGRWVSESLDAEHIQAKNVELRKLVPFAARRDEFDAAIAARKATLFFSRAGSPGIQPRTVIDWHSGDRYGQAFVSFGRLIRHDEKARPAATRVAWTDYDAARRDQVNQRRELETTAWYTLDDVRIGQGVPGFAKAMHKLAELPAGSIVNVRVCARTKGPFVCPLIYEGHRHFERTGFEPYVGLFPWLTEVARKHKLEIQWIPDEFKTCGDCELNK